MSRYKNFIATNFAYGTGPYLRTTELAIAVNDFLEKQGHERLGIIVPLVYGAKQEKIMREEVGDFYKSHPKEIILDRKLGSYLKSIFYGKERYEDYLARWLNQVEEVSKSINIYLKKKYGKHILLELHRSPRVLYNVAPAYFVSFAYISEIYENALGNKEIATDNGLLKRALPKISAIETSYQTHFLTEPGTFSYQEKKRGEEVVPIPPTILSYTNTHDREYLYRGIFVTVTGIPGLERLYEEAKKLGIKVYSNDTKAVPFAEKSSPHVISSPQILLQFARSGWSSVWLSMLSGTPLVVPEWDRDDDPEIYFNNICIEKLGLGIVYRGESLAEILKKAEQLRPGIEKYNQKLLKKFGTLDGTRYAAEKITEDFVNKGE